MRDIILITGGSRGGKSAYALKLAEEKQGPHLFVATCPRVDAEMDARIIRHQQERGPHWQTAEEERDLIGVLEASAPFPVVLVDCLTLWVSNMMLRDETLDEDGVRKDGKALLEVASQQEGTLILVTNEVGFSVVPENALARRFRDLAGRMNQVIAQGAQQVTLMVSGIPLALK